MKRRMNKTIIKPKGILVYKDSLLDKMQRRNYDLNSRTSRLRTFKSHSSKPVDKEKVYLKGADDYQIDVNDIEIVLKKLVPFADKPLNEAPQGELEEITNTVNVLCNTEYYPALQEVINKYFSSSSPTPGTVRAYMIGCNVKSDPCSSVCAGSAPANSNFNVCPDKVLIGIPEEGRYSFTLINNSSSTRALLYLPISCTEEFKGFSMQDQKELSKLEIKEVKILQSKEDVLLYDYTPVENLCEKENKQTFPSSSPPNVIPPPVTPSPQPQTNYTLWIVIGVVVIILLVLLLLYWRGRV